MSTDTINAIRTAMESAGVERFKIKSTGATVTLDANSESTKAFWDDSTETLWYIMVSTGCQPLDNRPMMLGCISYNEIESITVPSDIPSVISMAESAGLELTEEITTWIKGQSQSGLYPVQSNPRVVVNKEDGSKKKVLYAGRPTIH